MATIRYMCKQFLKSVFARFGIVSFFFKDEPKTDYVLFDQNTLSRCYTDSPFKRLYYTAMGKTPEPHFDSLERSGRFYSLYQVLKQALRHNPAGQIAECGAWHGHSAYIMSAVLQEQDWVQTFHVFDSFDGLTEFSDADRDERFSLSEERYAQRKAHFKTSAEPLQKTLQEFPFVTIHEGMIPATFSAVENSMFSFVHIDLDIYVPTLASLSFFYPRLLPNGIMQIDDYGETKFPGCKKAVDEFLENENPSFVYETPIGGLLIIK